MDAFGSLVGIFVPVLTTGSRTGQQVASTSKWRMLFCTTFGSTHPPAPPDCWSNGSHAEWTSAGRTSSFATAPVAAGNQYYQGQMVGQEWHMGQGQPWPQQQHPLYSQTNGSQGPAAQGSMRPLATGTQFASLAADKSKVVAHKPPSVGLQNTNNTCYMNSFVQALFLTDAFVSRIYSFSLKLKENPSTIDKEDFEFGKTVVELLKKQFAKMALTKHKHTDIWDILQAFPADYRSGEQQDVTETLRFVFDKLGGADQALLKEVFAGELEEKIQCRDCGNIKVRKETFTDLVVPVPTAKEAQESGYVPTMQQLLEERLKSEEMDDANNLVTCDICKRKTTAVKWSEITTPPAHLCLCLNRFTFNRKTFNFTKEKTPVKVDEGLSIGGYHYELYHTIIHTGKDASSGHYYAMGKRSEPTPSGDSGWYTMDDSQIKPADVSLLAGNPPEKLLDDNAYVLFLRCKQAPPTPEFRIPLSLFDYVKKEDKKQWGELNRAVKTFSFIVFHSLRSFIIASWPVNTAGLSRLSVFHRCFTAWAYVVDLQAYRRLLRTATP